MDELTGGPDVPDAAAHDQIRRAALALREALLELPETGQRADALEAVRRVEFWSHAALAGGTVDAPSEPGGWSWCPTCGERTKAPF